MKLTFNNFFSRLIFHPLEADTRNERIIALAATIACGIFSFGTCHIVCAIRNSFTHRSPDMATDQDRRISRASLGKITVTIPPEVKATLDKLFEGSPYSIDKLPVYPLLVKEQWIPERKHMSYPVMKAISDNGRPFIALKVECTLTDENIKDHEKLYRDYFKAHRLREDILVLFPYKLDESLKWFQYSGSLREEPSFFSGNFTYEDGTGPTEGQKDNFVLVQTLLKTGKSTDINGLLWRLSS